MARLLLRELAPRQLQLSRARGSILIKRGRESSRPSRVAPCRGLDEAESARRLFLRANAQAATGIAISDRNAEQSTNGKKLLQKPNQICKQLRKRSERWISSVYSEWKSEVADWSCFLKTFCGPATRLQSE